jgi:hypothetical protein
MAVGNRQFQWAQPSEQADYPGKTFFMFEVIASHITPASL